MNKYCITDLGTGEQHECESPNPVTAILDHAGVDVGGITMQPYGEGGRQRASSRTEGLFRCGWLARANVKAPWKAPAESASAPIWQAWATAVCRLPNARELLSAVPDRHRPLVKSHIITVRGIAQNTQDK